MAIRYEIDSNAVRVYDDNGVCFLDQPFHPEGRDWEGASEMEKWAKDFVANHGKVFEPAPVIVPETKTVIDLGK